MWNIIKPLTGKNVENNIYVEMNDVKDEERKIIILKTIKAFKVLRRH